MSNEDLPSINDIVEESNLPSYKDFIEVKQEEELPSVEEYIEEKVVDTLEEEDIETVLSETAPEWSELVRLVNDVRKDIPEIPEIKYYDEQLKELSDKLSQIQDLNEDKLTEIESKIPEIPEVKYYDADIQFIYDKIGRIKEEINSLPEVKYYESDLNSLKSRIEEVNQSIPTFPDWVQEVQEVPDFSWIGKTFSIIDDDFNKVQGHLDLIREKIDYRVNELNDTIATKEFELKIDVKDLTENFNQTVVNLEETKDKLLKQVRDVSTRIWEQHNEFKDDDRKLKKSIISEQNKLKQSLQEQIKEIDTQSVKADEALLKFFNDLNEEVKSLPEVKYYDTEVSNIVEDIDSLRVNIEDIRNIVSLIKKDQKELKELKENYLLNEPPDEKESVGSGVDPLTPMDQKFATLDDLSNHYRIFINRIQTQLSTMGGGGAGFIKDLDDVTFDQTTGNNKLLIYNSEISKWVGIGSDEFNAVGAAGTWGVDSVGIHTTKVVGINTTSAKSDVALFVFGNIEATGNVTVGGTITYEDVKNVDSIGIVTARSGINVLAGGITAVGVVTATSFSGDGSGLIGVASTNNIITGTAATFTGGVNISGASNINVTGVSTINTGIGTVHIGVGNTTLLVQGDARVTGILTIGTGSITLDPNERKITGIDEIIIGTATTVRIHQDTSGEVVFSDREGRQASVGIGTTVSINTTGIITAATLKASTAFYPPIYTTTQRDAGTFGEGAMIFNTTSKKMEFYNGTSWQSLPGMSLGLTVALDG
jgi:tetrahydromethanopterin S-methyltransferase subunit G